jgi:hypothetical protein
MRRGMRMAQVRVLNKRKYLRRRRGRKRVLVLPLGRVKVGGGREHIDDLEKRKSLIRSKEYAA